MKTSTTAAPRGTTQAKSRRTFLRSGLGWLAGGACLVGPVRRSVAGANDRIVLGLIGPGGMGTNLLRSFAAQSDVRIAWVCDPDSQRMSRAAQLTAEITGARPSEAADLRRVLEDPNVDAVIIAAPDHWHAPATLLACAAGKHVYVEKPCSHNVREGRLMIEAARRTRRVVQVGTQSRSTPHVQRAMQLLKEGAIGEILVAKAWNSQKRASIGRVPPSLPPAYLDFDLWLGPAPVVPYRSNLLPSVWRWWYAFGTGDMGNDGVHDLDIARWGLGVQTHPTQISGLGGKYFFDDDQQFPDTQYVVFEYDTPGRKKQLIYEHRIWSPYVQEGYENGNAFYGTEGMMLVGKSGGWQWFGPRNVLRESMTGRPDGLAHHRNFLECIRSGARPHADIEDGHLSASLCHLGNIAVRTGRRLAFDPVREKILEDRKAQSLLRREYRRRHWATPSGV
jgi:predicted dehydrogenase